MKARIYKPAKSSMQSAHGRSQDWVLECESSVAKTLECIMGWTSSHDTSTQVHLTFSTLEEAESFAQGNGFNYKVDPLHNRKVKPRNYADAFVYIPPQGQESS